MNAFPTDPKKLRARIRDYERKLQREKQQYGGAYDDSYGKRYLLGPMYLLSGDVTGALQSFASFVKEFSDDCGEAGQILCWSLAMYRAGKWTAAEDKLRQAMLMNSYILQHLLGRELVPIKPMKSGDFDTDKMYLHYMPPEYFAMWSKKEKGWAAGMYDSDEFQRARACLAKIESLLDQTEPSPERTQLVDDSFALIYGRKLARSN